MEGEICDPKLKGGGGKKVIELVYFPVNLKQTPKKRAKMSYG